MGRSKQYAERVNLLKKIHVGQNLEVCSCGRAEREILRNQPGGCAPQHAAQRNALNQQPLHSNSAKGGPFLRRQPPPHRRPELP